MDVFKVVEGTVGGIDHRAGGGFEDEVEIGERRGEGAAVE